VWGLSVRVFLLSAIVVVAGLAGCQPKVQQITGCSQDAECGASQRCDALSGRCLCTDDSACDPSEFCNIAGGCQPVLECLNNSDCEPTEFCDTNGGECIAKVPGICVLDSQCPFGSFCGQNRGCATGCRDDGDCHLGTPCIGGTCDETPGACNAPSFCEFGQTCGANNRCVDHPLKDQLCDDCGGGIAGAFVCPEDCLIDGSVTPTPCTNDGQCARGTCEPARCQTSADCPNGGTCSSFSGQCTTSICQGAFCGGGGCDDVTNPCPRGYSCGTLQIVSGSQCILGGPANQCGANRACNGGGENGNVGFCSCASDDDCPPSLEFDATCQNPGPGGACIIGTTCAPSDGLLCEDLR